MAEEGSDKAITQRNILADSSCKRHFCSLTFGFPPWCMATGVPEQQSTSSTASPCRVGDSPQPAGTWPDGNTSSPRLLTEAQGCSGHSCASYTSSGSFCSQGLLPCSLMSTSKQHPGTGMCLHTYCIRALKTEGKMSFHFPEDKRKVLASLAGKHCLEKGAKQSSNRNMHRLGSSIPAEPPALTCMQSTPACPTPAGLSDWHD